MLSTLGNYVVAHDELFATVESANEVLFRARRHIVLVNLDKIRVFATRLRNVALSLDDERTSVVEFESRIHRETARVCAELDRLTGLWTPQRHGRGIRDQSAYRYALGGALAELHAIGRAAEFDSMMRYAVTDGPWIEIAQYGEQILIALEVDITDIDIDIHRVKAAAGEGDSVDASIRTRGHRQSAGRSSGDTRSEIR